MRYQWRVGVATLVVATLIAASPAASQRLQATTLEGGDRPILLSVNVAPNGLQGLVGLSVPGAQILVRVEGRLVGATIADGSGAWFMTLPAPLANGRHVMQIASRSVRDGVLRHGEMTEVTVPLAGSGSLRELTSSEERAIEQAGSFADEATRMFDQLAPMLEQRAGAGVLGPAGGVGDIGSRVEAGDGRSLLDLAGDWLDRAARHYRGVVVQGLALRAVSSTSGSAAGEGSGQHGAATTLRRAQVGAPEKDVLDQIVEGIRAWFARANRDYQAVIVRHLSEPAPTDTSSVLGRSRSNIAAVPRPTAPVPDRRTFVEKRAEQTATAKAAETGAPAKPAPKVAVPAAAPQRDGIEIMLDALGGWFSRANRDYHAVIVRHLVEAGGTSQSLVPRGESPLPGPKGPPPPSGGDEVAQSADQATRLAALEKRRADEERAEQERRREAAEASRREAEQAMRRSAEEAAKAAKAKAADDARRLADAQAQAEADKQRTLAAEAARRAEAAKRSDDERRAGEDARRLAQAEAARVAANQRIVEEQKRRIAEEDRRKVEEERRRAEDERRRAAEADRKATAAAVAAAAAETARQNAERRAAERAVRGAAAAEARTARSTERAVRSKRAYSKAATPRVAAGSRSVVREVSAAGAARSAPSAVRARVVPAVRCPNARVVVVETRTGVYNSVFNKDIDQRRVVVAYNSPLAAQGSGCQTVAQRE